MYEADSIIISIFLVSTINHHKYVTRHAYPNDLVNFFVPTGLSLHEETYQDLIHTSNETHM